MSNSIRLLTTLEVRAIAGAATTRATMIPDKTQLAIAEGGHFGEGVRWEYGVDMERWYRDQLRS